jgi:hypothetical protein
MRNIKRLLNDREWDVSARGPPLCSLNNDNNEVKLYGMADVKEKLRGLISL